MWEIIWVLIIFLIALLFVLLLIVFLVFLYTHIKVKRECETIIKDYKELNLELEKVIKQIEKGE